MKKEALKRIFEFLEEKEEHNMPFKLKLIFNKPLTKEDLNVKGYLNLRDTNITSLPEGLKVGSLSLRDTNITSLPKGLKVSNFLDLESTSITSLPEDLKVGSLGLRDTNITSLPKGLKVRFFLDLRNTKITSLPKGLEVHSSLFIINTALLEYTDEELREMVKPGFIKGKILRQ
jgi:hypothetical protein